MLGFLDAGVGVAYHLVTIFLHVLTPLAGPFAAATAIVACTAAVRLLLLPLSYYAMRGQAAQARLQPELAELRRRYAGQPDRLQRELTALYQREGSGLAAGCLPLLAQLPFFAIMYRLFRSRQVGGQVNQLLTHHLLAAPLGAHWLTGAGPVSGQGLVFLGLFVLLALTAWLTTRLTSQPATAPGAASRAVTIAARALPYSTIVVAAFVPLAAALYLLTTTCWTAAERLAFRRLATRLSPRNELLPRTEAAPARAAGES